MLLRLFVFLTYIFLVFLLYFLFISLSLFFTKKNKLQETKKLKFAVLIPARNEEKCISKIIRSLKKQDYPKKNLEIFTIINNCTDKTEEVALKEDAKIIKAPYNVKNKGEALNYGIKKIIEDYDVFLVFDADNEASENFVSAMNKEFSNGASLVKSKIFAKNQAESWISVCYDIHFCTANSIVNRARANLGLSARIIGTGFGVTSKYLKECGGFQTKSLAEDAEFFIGCIADGKKVAFCEEAITYDEEPTSFEVSLIQRKRWTSGIMSGFKMKFIPLIKSLGKKGSFFSSLDTLIQFLFIYVRIAFFTLGATISIVHFNKYYINVLYGILISYIVTIVFAWLMLLIEKRFSWTWTIIKGIVLYPIFLLSFVFLEILSLIHKTHKWQEIKHLGVGEVSLRK